MAYVSSKQEREQVKRAVFQSIAPGLTPTPSGRETVRLNGVSVHARYCATASGNFKFNINPNTLRADFELWICGDKNHWYLIPVGVLQRMYHHPSAYPDNHHPEIRVVSVDSRTHRVGYASPRVTLDLSPFFRDSLHS